MMGPLGCSGACQRMEMKVCEWGVGRGGRMPEGRSMSVTTLVPMLSVHPPSENTNTGLH